MSLSSVVTNKDLVSFSETESLALADITRSFGYKLKTEEHLSDRSCLTCARNFARSTAVIAKRFSGEKPNVSGKRPSDCRSPRGEIPRMKRGSGQGSEKTTDNSRRSLGLGESPPVHEEVMMNSAFLPFLMKLGLGWISRQTNSCEGTSDLELQTGKQNILEMIYLSVFI